MTNLLTLEECPPKQHDGFLFICRIKIIIHHDFYIRENGEIWEDSPHYENAFTQSGYFYYKSNSTDFTYNSIEWNPEL